MNAKYGIRARLLAVTGWRLDLERLRRAADAPLSPLRSRELASQVRQRLEDCTDRGAHLPFEYEFETGSRPTDRSVGERVLDEYARTFYHDDFVFPASGDVEWTTTGKRLE